MIHHSYRLDFLHRSQSSKCSSHLGAPWRYSISRRSERITHDIRYRDSPSWPGEGRLLQPVFIVPRGTGVSDLPQSRAIQPQHQVQTFKMETLQSVISMMLLNRWMASVDLKDAYFHISIYKGHWEVPAVLSQRSVLPIQGHSV